ncbi:hypothetical protein [Mycobacterium kubicae]|uniref:hypothetical protein n=1 Tax=Mycobacterium kubicae TaxID=120959 RepID=UPI0007FFA80B|nr:hypothetical protein [Mycobacterium kubicae]OBK53146.1 hypothetical protein A5657_15575 [Mycobacterium kubicae]
MTTTEWCTGKVAAELHGLTVAGIDAAVASGALDARYEGWRLMVAAPPTKPRKAGRKALK